jgi:hypothetical protein
VRTIDAPFASAKARSSPSSGAQRAPLPDGRWHFHHGPIDLVIGADGDPQSVSQAVEAAWRRFEIILPELVGELRLLRSPVQQAQDVKGSVARRMIAACWPHRSCFITPMAAVAGAVADELIECFGAQAGVRRAYVNDGGDIALHLAAGESFQVGPDRATQAAAPGRPVRSDGRAAGARRGHQRLARAQPQPGHRRQRDGAGGHRRASGRGCHHDRQRGVCRR